MLFATGFGDARDALRPILDDEVAARLTRIGDLDDEGESNGWWRELGTEGLWYMIGG